MKLKLLAIGDLEKTSNFVFENRKKYRKWKFKEFKSGKIAVFGRK